MTKISNIAALLLTVFSIVTFSSCEDEGRKTIIITPNVDKPTYTIMYFACGGATLDYAIERTLDEMMRSGVDENIKFTCNVKWTKGYTSLKSDGSGSVYRSMLDSENGYMEYELVGDNSYPLYKPENIADFIEWSKEVAPSDNYILILAGHGNGWHPATDSAHTRGTIRDTDLNRYISLEELNEALDMSNTHFRLIQMVSCLMNTMEYITALSDNCDYILGSSHVSLMLCNEPSIMQVALKSIKDDSDESFVEAMRDLVSNIGTELRLLNDPSVVIDYSVTDTSKVEQLNQAISLFTDQIIALYNEESAIGADAMREKYGVSIAEIEAELANSYAYAAPHLSPEEFAETEYVRQSFTYDIVDIVRHAANSCAGLSEAATMVEQQAREARIINHTMGVTGMQQTYYGVSFTNSENWISRRYEEGGYLTTEFDLATGWSRLLRINNTELIY